MAILFSLSSLFLSAHAFELTFSRGVPKEQKQKLINDIEVLKNFHFREAPDQESLKLLDVKNLETATMVKWLSDRVQYIVEEKDIEKFRLRASREDFVYPYPGQVPQIEIPSRLAANDDQGITVMSNIGTAFYFIGKLSDELLRLKLRVSFFKSEKIDITSPRVGILQIGEGLFLPKLDFNRENPQALSNSINRLSTLFHEARHSDGHGTHLGFFHAPCPSTHPYAGQAACDKNLNGPYAIGAQMLKEFAKNCSDCTEEETEQMKLSFLDSRSRIITETVKPILTTEQQKLLDRIDEALKVLMDKLTSDISDDQAQLLLIEFFGLSQQREALIAQAPSVEVIASPFLDPKPEGMRRR